MQLKNTPSILCFIDFSESSMSTLKWAAGMAVSLKTHLSIVHPYRLNQLNKKEDMVLVKKNIDLDAAKNFEKIATSLLKNEAMSYEFRTEVGFIQDRVQEYARKNNILFMVMGKKLVTSYNENLNEFMDQIEVPLVIVPY